MAYYTGFQGGQPIASAIVGDEGVGVRFGGGGERYAVQANLLDVTSSGQNFARSTDPYIATLTPATGLTIDTVVVTMGGVDITSTVWDSGSSKITVAAPTADIVIYASAVTTPDTITLNDVDSSFRTKTSAVVADVNEGDASTISFIVITDPHSDNPSTNKSQNIARYLLKNSRANKLFLLGDYCNTNWVLAEWQAYAAPLLNCAEKVYATIGNHEWFGNPSGTGLSDIYDDFLAAKNIQNGVPSSFYYYIDDTVHKVRYIVINTSEGATNAVSSTQLSWLNSAVQLPTSEWGIIAMSHFPVYRSNSSGEITSSESVSDERYAIRDALLTTNGTLLMYLCGHTHADVRYVVDYSFYEQVLTCDLGETAVTVFNVNLETGAVSEYRIGNRGTDMSFDFDDLPAMVTRTISNTLTGCTTNNGATSTINGRPYSATLTPEANYDLSTGTVVITMGGVDVTSTAYDSSTRAISISAVDGDLSITATATYVAPLTEFTADWFSKGTTRSNISFPANMKNVDSEFPDYFCVIYTNGPTTTTTGFRGNTYAGYGSRTSGYTQKIWNLINATGSEGKVAFTTTTLPEKTVDGNKYVFHTFTRADHDAAWAARVAAIAGGQVAQAGNILVYNKTPAAGADIWVIAENVTSSNFTSYARRLPTHLLNITASFVQGDNVIYDTATLDDLIPYLTVTGKYTYNNSAEIASTDYTLSGTIAAGTCTITVTSNENTTLGSHATATFTVEITAS